MAPSCGGTVVNCSTTEHHRGTQAFEPDGTLVVFKVDHAQATWQRVERPGRARQLRFFNSRGATLASTCPACWRLLEERACSFAGRRGRSKTSSTISTP